MELTYKELININSNNPDPKLLKIFIDNCTGTIEFYRSQYKETKDRYWLGKITKYSKWKKEAEYRQLNLTTINVQ